MYYFCVYNTVRNDDFWYKSFRANVALDVLKRYDERLGVSYLLMWESQDSPEGWKEEKKLG